MRPLHISLNTTHSECRPSSSISSFTHSLQVFLPLLAHLTPATTTFLQADTQSSPLLRSTMPKPPQSTTPHHLSHALNPQKTVQIHSAFSILQRHPTHPSHHHPLRIHEVIVLCLFCGPGYRIGPPCFPPHACRKRRLKRRFTWKGIQW